MTGKIRCTSSIGFRLVLLAGLLANASFATYIVDLTAINSVQLYSNAVFLQGAVGSGTGVLNVGFVGISGNTPTTQGYNSSYRPVQFNEDNPAGQNFSVLLTSVGTYNYGGETYFRFALDANESGGGNLLLSVDRIQLYLSQNPALTGYIEATHSFPTNPGDPNYAYKMWDLDLGPGGDASVILNSGLSTGSGTSDIYVYIPVDLIYSYPHLSPNTYVYLYSQFGAYVWNSGDIPPTFVSGTQQSDGFEEWAYIIGPSYVPEPSTAFFIVGGLTGLWLWRRRRAK